MADFIVDEEELEDDGQPFRYITLSFFQSFEHILPFDRSYC